MMKGRVCVTGGTGFLGSWTIKRLLQHGYSVNTTIRMDPEGKRDIRFLTNLPGASERLQIFNADLNKPEEFAGAIQGCVGVFHMAHPVPSESEEKVSKEFKIKRAIRALEVILEACVDSKTVKRVVYTSSVVAADLHPGRPTSSVLQEDSWTDVECLPDFWKEGDQYDYVVTKTLTEKAALELGHKLGLDVVSLLPIMVAGPFITPRISTSVSMFMALIFGTEEYYKFIMDTSIVHVDDVARAHIHLFEYPQAKGRYFISGVDTKIEELRDLISARYPEFNMPSAESWKDGKIIKISEVSQKKLEETGFKNKYGLKEMLDGSIKSCREIGIL